MFNQFVIKIDNLCKFTINMYFKLITFNNCTILYIFIYKLLSLINL